MLLDHLKLLGDGCSCIGVYNIHWFKILGACFTFRDSFVKNAW